MVSVVVVAGTLLATLVTSPRPRLIWNASPSSPVGLYRIESVDGARRGDMVVAWPPAAVRRWAAERHYLPLNVPLVKPVVAAGGDRICGVGRDVFVNGKRLASRLRADRYGRRLPWWQGCRTLAPGQLLLLSAAVPEAFDGRYFGITEQADQVGRARRLWPLG